MSFHKTVTFLKKYFPIILIALLLILTYSLYKEYYGEKRKHNVYRKVKTFLFKRDKIHNLLNDDHKELAVYNPSISFIHTGKDKGKYDAIFRASSFSGCLDVNEIFISHYSFIYKGVITDKGDIESFELMDLPYKEMNRCNDILHSWNGYEDARLFTFRNELWCISNVTGDRDDYTCVTRMCIWKINSIQDTYMPLNPPDFFNPNGGENMEKNWCPFEYNNELYAEYMVNPRKIIKIDIDSGECEIVSYYPSNKKFPTLRGGASAIPIKYQNDFYFLNIAHNSINLKSGYFKDFINGQKRFHRDYIHYFYIFEVKPPFNIIGVSPPFKLGNSDELIQFACGITYNDITNKIVVSYGEGDCYSALSYYDLNEIFKSLQF